MTRTSSPPAPASIVALFTLASLAAFAVLVALAALESPAPARADDVAEAYWPPPADWRVDDEKWLEAFCPVVALVGERAGLGAVEALASVLHAGSSARTRAVNAVTLEAPSDQLDVVYPALEGVLQSLRLWTPP